MCEKLKNLKNTELEIAILLSSKIMSAKELQESVKVDKATIYRNLKSLLKKGIIREIKNIDGISFYEIDCKKHNPIHPHFECTFCKKIYCLSPLAAEDILALSNYTKFEIEKIDITFKGICDECKNEK